MAKKKPNVIGYIDAKGKFSEDTPSVKKQIQSIKSTPISSNKNVDMKTLQDSRAVKTTQNVNDIRTIETKDIRTQKTEQPKKSTVGTVNSEGYTETSKKYGDYKYQDYANKKDYKIYTKDNKSYYYDEKNKRYVDMDEQSMTTKDADKKEYKNAVKQGYKGSRTYNSKDVQVEPSKVADKVALESSDLTKEEKEKYKKSLIKQEKQKGKETNFVKRSGTGIDALTGAWNNQVVNPNGVLQENVIQPISNAGRIYESGKMNNELALEWYKKMQGKPNKADELQAKADTFNRFNQDVASGDIGAVGQTIQNLNTQVESLKNQGIAASAGGLIGAGGGALVGLKSGNPIGGAIKGAKLGSKAGYTFGSTPYMYKLEAGNQYKDLIEMGVSHKKAKKVAKAVGTINAAIESGENIIDLFSFEGAGKIASNEVKNKALKQMREEVGEVVEELGEKQAKSYLSKLYGSEIAENIVKTYGKNVASEAVEEGTQEAVGILGERYATGSEGIDRGVSLQQDLQRIGQSGLAGGMSALVMGIPTSLGGNAVSYGAGKANNIISNRGVQNGNILNSNDNTFSNTNQIREIIEQKNNGQIDAEEANNRIADVQNGTYQQNQNNQAVIQEAQRQFDAIQQAEASGVIDSETANQERQAIINTVNQITQQNETQERVVQETQQEAPKQEVKSNDNKAEIIDKQVIKEQKKNNVEVGKQYTYSNNGDTARYEVKEIKDDGNVVVEIKSSSDPNLIGKKYSLKGDNKSLTNAQEYKSNIKYEDLSKDLKATRYDKKMYAKAKNTDMDMSEYDRTMEFITPNRAGNYSKQQILSLAEELGKKSKATTGEELKQEAINYWVNKEPYKKTDSKTKYLGMDEFLKAYYKGAGVGTEIETQEETPKTQEIKQETKVEPKKEVQRKLKPVNTKDKVQNFRNSVANENIKDKDGFYKAVEKIIKDKDYNVILDSSITNEKGQSVNALITNDNGVTIKINPKSERAGEILLMHEVTHGIETKEMRNLILDYAKKNSEFNDALENLKEIYGTEDVTPEVVADISGQLLGNQEFINSLSVEKPTLFKRILDALTSLKNKLTGNSKYENFVKDLEAKYREAYRKANQDTANQNLKNATKYSQNAEITDNKGRPININMQNYMEDSQATDAKGRLVTLYHTTTDMIKQFNEFDPANKYDPSQYKFGKYNVTYLTDNEEMSESYSMYDPRKADTRRLNSIKEAEDYLENTSLRLVDKENTNQAIKNHFKDNDNRYFLVGGDLTTFGEYKTEKELLRDVIPTAQQVMRGNSNFKYEVYANITKPYIIDAEGNNWDRVAREINQESKKVVDSLTNEQKEELSKYANESLDEWQKWHMSDDYLEYKRYDDVYKNLNQEEQENLIIMSMKDNFTPQDYVDAYNEYGKDFNMRDPDSKIELNPYGEVKMQRAYKDFVAEWCRLEAEAAKYENKDSYFLSKTNKKYNQQLRAVGADKMFDMAKYNFKDWAVEDTLSSDLKTNDIVKKVIEMNENGEDYDGIIIKNTTDYGVRSGDEPHDVYVVFNSNQIKSVDNPDPTSDPDIRYSKKTKKWQEFLDKNFKERGTRTKLNEKTTPKKLGPALAEVRKEVEEKTNKTMSKHIETSSKATNTVDDIKNMNYDDIVYDEKTHKASQEQALRELEGKDIDTNINDIHAKFRGTERLTNVDSAKITELMKQTKSLADEAAKNGNDSERNKRMEQFRTLKGDYAVALSESGQFTEYAKVIKELDPETQVDVLRKVIEKEQRRGNKKYEDVKINEELEKKYKEAKTDEERDAIMEEIKDDTARQIKITLVDKANEFRFLSMLGNIKTHGRNIFGNVGMYSLQSFKDGVAAIGEDIYNKTSKNGLETRSKTLKPATKEVSSFVNDKVDSFMKDITNKYNESRGMKGDLERRTKKFSDNNIIGKALNKASDINSKALDFEDKFFSSKMTKQAMKGFLTANGIETNADIEAHPELVAQALDYALFKGKEATFHQDSTTATAIRNFRDKLYTGSGFSKLGGLAIDTTLPFVSTPANIAKNALEYTPVIGFGDINKQFQNAPDNMKANVVIDSLSKQFTGGALMAVGAYLASQGLVKGSGDDDKEDKTEASLGNASYSIKIGNSTYDLSWLSPTAIPFFEGVEVFNAFKKANSKGGLKATDTADLIDTMFGTLNPMTDMSVLQSIERVITSITYGGNAVKSATSTTFSSYLQQYIPTLLSQIAQVGDTKQRNTNTGGNVIDKTIDQIKYKIPGARNTLPEKVDVWGDTNKTAGNIPQRMFEAFLSPANRKDYKVDNTTKELERLARETDDTSMLPTVKNKKLRVNGEDHDLKGKDYVDLQKTYGKTAKKNLDKLIKSDAYKNADDNDKKSMVGKLYDYASYKAKEKYAKNKGINFDSGNQTSFAMIDAFGIPYEKYVENQVSGNQGASDMLNNLNGAGLSEAQKGAVMNYFDRAYYVNEDELYDTLENSNLSEKQKELIKAKYEKNITDKERERYQRADNIGVDYDLYTNFRSFVNKARGESRTGGPTKKQKVINWIQEQELTAEQKYNLYYDYINNQGIFSYYK